MPPTVHELRGVSFAFPNGREVLSGCDFLLREGDFVAVIGPNGAGKSTLLNLLTGYLSPKNGEVNFRGKPLRAWNRRDLACHIAVVPQREETTFPFTVEQAVLMGRYIHQAAPFGFESDEDHAIAREAIAMVDLEGLANRRATELSGGEQQRLLIARALAQKSPVLLLDEPTSSLDIAHQQLVFSLLERLNRELGLTILTISHDINLAALYCKEIAILSDGCFVARGAPQEVLTETRLSEVYRASVSVTAGESGAPTVMLRK